MRFVKSAALCSVLFPVAAFAQEAAPATPAAATPAGDIALQKKITIYGRATGIMNLIDTERKADIDFTNEDARVGVKINEGIVRGTVETGLLGERRDADGTYHQDWKAINVRAANAGVQLPSGTTFLMGRVRPTGATYWGADSTTGTDGWGPIDGLLLSQNFALDKNLSFTGEVSVGNTFIGLGTQFDGRGVTNFRQTDFNKREKAYVFTLLANAYGLNVSASFGIENKNLIKVTAENQGQASDIYHFEGGLGYYGDSFNGGAYVQVDRENHQKTITNYNGNWEYQDVIPGTPRRNVTVRSGIGGGIDSGLFGMTDMLQKGDKLGADIGYEYQMNRQPEISDSDEQKNDIQRISADTYYSVGSLTYYLAYAHEWTENNNYKTPGGAVARDYKDNLYLRAYLGF